MDEMDGVDKMDENFIDKWTFYRAAKYCDEIIPTGYSPAYKKRKFKYNNGTTMRIDKDAYDNGSQFRREFGHPGKKLAIFYKLINGESVYLMRTIQEISFDVATRRFDVIIDKPLDGSFGPENDAECCAEIY